MSTLSSSYRMNAHPWISFVGSSLVMGLVPGPGVMSIVGCALGSGRRTALAFVAAMLIATFSAVVGCTDTLYALVAANSDPSCGRLRSVGRDAQAGGVLIAAGLATAAARD